MPDAAADNRPPTTGSTTPYALAALALLLIGAAGHIAYLLYNCPLDLSGDEAHYWEWSRRLDLSYYSKGPLVAYIIALGRFLLADVSMRLMGNEVLAVRIPAIILSLLTGMGIFTLTLQTLRRPGVALGAVALTFTMPILAVGAILMTIDAPLACLYVWTLVCCTYALHTGRLWPWLLAGVMIALGILAKYTMVLVFPVIGLAILTEPPYRHYLRRPGPYLATAIGFCGLLPIVIWNIQHNWVSFRHVAGQAGVASGPSFDVGGVLNYVGGQLGVVGAVWLIAMAWAVVRFWSQPTRVAANPQQRADLRLLLYATLTPWTIFLIFSPLTKIQPNWPVLALITGTPLLALWLAHLRSSSQPRERRNANALMIVGATLGLATVVIMHRTEWVMPLMARLSPPESALNLTPLARLDPTARLRGWSQLGDAVGRQLDAAEQRGQTPFILTGNYQIASQVAFYTPTHPDVYCIQAALGFRQSQYDLWHPNPLSDPNAFVGRPCLYVGSRDPALFDVDEDGHVALPGAELAETVEHRVDGHALRIWPIWYCPSYAGLSPHLMEHVGTEY